MSESYENENRFWWLHHNTLFEITPLAGYSFIHNAKRLLEVLFWYLIIIIFTIITVINVKDAVMYYMDKPTKSGVQIASNTETASIGNISLVLNISLKEFINFPFYSNIPFIPGSKEKSTVCAESLINNSEEELLVERLSNKLLEWNNKKKTIPEIEENPWKQKLIDMRQKHGSKLKKYFENDETDQWSIYNVMQDMTDENWNELYYVLRLLSASLSEEDNDKLNSFLKLPSNFTGNTFVENVLKFQNITARQLFAAAASGLKNGLPIELILTDKNSAAQAYVTDWMGLSANQFASEILFGNRMQKITFQINLPRNTQELLVTIHSQRLDHYMYIIEEAFRLLYAPFDDERLQTSFNRTDCDGKTYQTGDLGFDEKKSKIMKMEANFQRNQINGMFDWYRRTTGMHIITQGGTIFVEPFKKHSVQLVPTGRFISDIDNCYSHTLTTCHDMCMADFHEKKCKCQSFPLLYLNPSSDIPVCSRPCHGHQLQYNHCHSKCERLMAHPCDTTLYRMEMTSATSLTPNVQNQGQWMGDGLIRPLFYVKLKMQKVINYPAITESYEMTPGKFMSHLGGLIDFWLGVNIIGIIHLIIYLGKQCFHAPNKSTKTGRTTRRLFGQTISVPTEMEEISAEIQDLKRRIQKLESNRRKSVALPVKRNSIGRRPRPKNPYNNVQTFDNLSYM